MIAVDLEIEWAHPGYLKRRADDALEAADRALGETRGF